MCCFFLFSSVISQRWRSDTFDNSGPRGVNTQMIAHPSASVCEYLPAYQDQDAFLLLVRPYADSQRGGGWGTRKMRLEEKKKLSMCFIVHNLHPLHNTSSLHSANCHFHHDDEKISINHRRVIMTSVKNNTEDINQLSSQEKLEGGLKK